MEIYLIVFTYLVLLAGIKPYSKSLFISSLILSIFIGFRYDVGVDYMSYFNWYNNEIIGDFSLSYVEPGFTLLAQLLKSYHMPASILFAASAAITMYFTYKAILDNDSSNRLSLLLFMVAGGYSFAINGVRQAIAASIFIYSIKYLVEGKKSIYVIWIIIASLFHYSASILLLLAIMPNKTRLKTKYYLGLYLLVLAIIFFIPIGNVITRFLSEFSILPMRYQMLLNNAYVTGEAQLSTGLGAIVTQVIILTTLLVSHLYTNLNDRTNLLLNLYFVYAILTLISLDIVIFSRITVYFLWSIFLFVPRLTDSLREKYTVIVSNKFIFTMYTGIAYVVLFIAGALNLRYKILPYNSVLF
jgi:hypothetical protein